MPAAESGAVARDLHRTDNTPIRRVFAAELIGREGALIIVYRGTEYLLACNPDAGELVLFKAQTDAFEHHAGSAHRCRAGDTTV